MFFATYSLRLHLSVKERAKYLVLFDHQLMLDKYLSVLILILCSDSFIEHFSFVDYTGNRLMSQFLWIILGTIYCQFLGLLLTSKDSF